MDLTGTFYKIMPAKSIFKKLRKEHKNFKDGVSIMLCSNFDKPDGIKPILIRNSKNLVAQEP